jgi:ribosome biogenesis GTPase
MSLDLPALGWDEYFQSLYRPYVRPCHRPGRVSRVDRGVCSVLAADGTIRASVGGALLADAVHDAVRLPCAGDWIVVRSWPDERTTVEAVLRRRTAIIRGSAGAEATAQVLAANVDIAAVVAPVDPEPDIGMIERLVALAWASGAQPVVVLTKIDMAAKPGPIVAEVAEAAPNVDVYAVSATTGAGMDRLRTVVRSGVTLGLLGASGAGKSTLVNALAGATVMGTQAIRRADGRGRHTTTFRALVPLPGGGSVLDTPGIRSVGLIGYGDASETPGLDRTFADIDQLAGLCRFGDCSHTREPGCAVAAALATGELTPRRLANWSKLRREIAHETRRHDARLAAEDRLRWRRLQFRTRGNARP